jgi:hypothetical protein
VIWFVHVSSTSLHIWLGLSITLILVLFSLIALATREMRLLGVIGIVYACILPALGLRQYTLLDGNLHWLIQSLHLLIGVGSLGVIHIIGSRYQRLKLATAKAAPQATYRAS